MNNSRVSAPMGPNVEVPSALTICIDVEDDSCPQRTAIKTTKTETSKADAKAKTKGTIILPTKASKRTSRVPDEVSTYEKRYQRFLLWCAENPRLLGPSAMFQDCPYMSGHVGSNRSKYPCAMGDEECKCGAVERFMIKRAKLKMEFPIVVCYADVW